MRHKTESASKLDMSTMMSGAETTPHQHEEYVNTTAMDQHSIGTQHLKRQWTNTPSVPSTLKGNYWVITFLGLL
jgi:hypothetical protein